MTYFHTCNKCGKQFLTGEMADFTCVRCLGLFPPLTYMDLTEEEKHEHIISLRELQNRYAEIEE